LRKRLEVAPRETTGSGGGDAAVLDAIVQILADSGKPLKASALVPLLRVFGHRLERADVNRVLYGVPAKNLLLKDESFQWSLRPGVAPKPRDGARAEVRANRVQDGPVGVYRALPEPDSKKAQTRSDIPDTSVCTGWPPYGPVGVGSAVANGGPGGPCWTDEQKRVIELDPSARGLVVAGPGTGKTFVACARAAWLLGQGLSPSNILMFSFTRAAVAEIRDRIGAVAKAGDEDAAAVRISTLDSAAWHLNRGLGDESKDEKVFTSFGENIERALELLRAPSDGLREFVERMRHVIVDEAQDLVGDRSRLVIAILKSLAPDCGVTVFADPAQAIYGFSNDEDDDLIDEEPFINQFKRAFPEAKEYELCQLHRTKKSDLVKLFASARKAVTSSPGSRLDEVRTAIGRNADRIEEALEKQQLTDQHLVLFRRRSEVLQASSFISSSQKGAARTHRLRLSGFPQVIHPWIGVTLWDLGSNRLTKQAFEERWAERMGSLPEYSRDHAWRTLQRFAGGPGGAVNLTVLRSVLSRPRPPIEFGVSDAGAAGPILGTIHASKGRQAPKVVLVLPEGRVDDQKQQEEEARVLYVGATRAQELLRLKSALRTRFSRHQSGRVFHGCPGKKIQFEIGKEGDFIRESPVVPRFLADEADAVSLQAWLQTGPCHAPCSARLEKLDGTWEYVLRRVDGADGGPILGGLSNGLVKELQEIARSRGAKALAPKFINHLVIYGVETVVLAPDSPAITRVHPRFQRLGIFLAPLVKGLTTCKLID
jgi:AAA domain/UvrD-like helicase C-terminal domain